MFYDNIKYYGEELPSYTNSEGGDLREPRLIPIKSYTMINKNHVEIIVISWGATIVSLKYPDKFGRSVDVVLGFDDLESATSRYILIFV